MRALAAVVLALGAIALENDRGLARPAQQAPAGSVVGKLGNLVFHSDPLINLHHVLYAAAWERRAAAGAARRLAEPLPKALEADMTAAERREWQAAIEHYDREVAGRDLLFGRGMGALKQALASGDLSAAAVAADLRGVLERAMPIYRRYFWPAHDEANRAWARDVLPRATPVSTQIIERLTRVYTAPWIAGEARVDLVWVGNRQGAYTTIEPPHATITTTSPDQQGWAGVELIFHEFSHVLILPVQRRLQQALGDAAAKHGELWHAVQFYVTGEVVRQVLETRNIPYDPFSTAMFARVWGRYRDAVVESWRPYIDGRATLDAAIDRTIRRVG